MQWVHLHPQFFCPSRNYTYKCISLSARSFIYTCTHAIQFSWVPVRITNNLKLRGPHQLVQNELKSISLKLFFFFCFLILRPRPIVIDGQNVAVEHAKRSRNPFGFSSRGRKIAVDYFKAKGCKLIEFWLQRMLSRIIILCSNSNGI